MDLEMLKQKEKSLRENEDNKYFLSKVNSPVLYHQITETVAPYLLDDKLKMLNHPWNTQLNESMNNSVASYAPKTKNFNGTISLRTRVGIAAAVMALGYEHFWTRVLRQQQNRRTRNLQQRYVIRRGRQWKNCGVHIIIRCIVMFLDTLRRHQNSVFVMENRRRSEK